MGVGELVGLGVGVVVNGMGDGEGAVSLADGEGVVRVEGKYLVAVWAAIVGERNEMVGVEFPVESGDNNVDFGLLGCGVVFGGQIDVKRHT